MKATTILLPGVLLASGRFINCSSDSGTTTPVFPVAGAAGAPSGGAGTAGTAGISGAAPASGGGGATSGGAGGGVSNAGASGAATGTPPDANNKCVPGALLHPDDKLCYCQPTTLN